MPVLPADDLHKDLQRNLKVCPNAATTCAQPRTKRLEWTFDDGRNSPASSCPARRMDPLRFRDQKRYADRLREAREKTGLEDAIIVAHGIVGGQKVVALPPWRSSSWAAPWAPPSGEGIVAAARLAVLQDAALVIFTASGGARMQEGAISLMQMPRTTIAAQMVKEAHLPFITVLTDPTTGGVTASFAMLGDIQIAEPGALIGFAGARVIEQTVRETLPEGFQRAEYLHEHGIIDMVVKRGDMPDPRWPGDRHQPRACGASGSRGVNLKPSPSGVGLGEALAFPGTTKRHAWWAAQSAPSPYGRAL